VRDLAIIKPRLIVFLGTVGSGKSTQRALLASYLSRKGVKVKVATLKTSHLIACLLEVILARILASRRKDVYPIRALLEEKPHFFKKVFKLWLALDIISVAVKFLFSIYIPLKLGYVMLVEEYIPATISDYIYLSRVVGFTLKSQSFTVTFPLRLMQLGGPTQMVFLDAENSELKSRWKHRKSFNERHDYLCMQRTLLLSLSKSLSHALIYINTSNQTIEQTHRLILDFLRKS